MKLCGFGDSLTAGAFMAQEDTWLYKVGQRFGFDTIQAGIGGNTSADGLSRISSDVLAVKPDLCVATFGMNDHCAEAAGIPKVSTLRFAENLREIVRQLREIDCIPVLCTIHPIILGDEQSYYYARHPKDWYVQPEGADAWLEQYNEVLRKVAREEAVDLADIAMHWQSFLLDGGRLDDVLMTVENSGRSDGVHQSAMGHNLYAECIGSCISQILEKRGSEI